MRTGRPRKPTAQKRLEGTFRPDRANPDEPVVPEGVPVPPSFLGETELAKWDELVKLLTAMDVLTVADGDALAQYCLAWGQYVRAAERLIADGDLIEIKSASGVVQKLQRHPSLAIQSAALEQMNKIGSRFGLSPSDRTKLRTNTPQKSETDGFLDRKRKPRKAPDLKVAK